MTQDTIKQELRGRGNLRNCVPDYLLKSYLP